MFKEKAIHLHKKGYNCCQAVLCTFAEELGLDEVTLFKIAEGFGAGMGDRQGPCGALSAVIIIVGMINSDGNIDNPASKLETYRLSEMIVKEFENKIGNTSCGDIKNRAIRSCDQCITIAVDIAQNIIKRSKF